MKAEKVKTVSTDNSFTAEGNGESKWLLLKWVESNAVLFHLINDGYEPTEEENWWHERKNWELSEQCFGEGEETENLVHKERS